MKQRNRRRASRPGSPRGEQRPTPPSPKVPGTSRTRLIRPVATVLIVAGATALSLWLTLPSSPRDGAPPVASSAVPSDSAPDNDPDSAVSPHGHPAASTPKATGDPDNFLDAFTAADSAPKEPSGETPGPDADLEKQFHELTAISDRLDGLKDRMAAAIAASRQADLEKAAAERDQLVNQLNQKSSAFEKTVGEAQRARPNDPVPQWLSAELLMLVGGEPDQLLPRFQKAATQGLKRPRLLASLSRVQVEANQFAEAYRTAAEAQAQDRQDRYIWNAYTRSAFCLEKYLPVLARLDRAFPERPPEWATAMRHDATQSLVRWQAEQKLRQAEAKADDLPRVRLLIEHRRFAAGPNEGRLTKIESTGREEAVLELFEDQAPATVSNFLDLVERGFYDGTSFHLAESAALVVGGDPLTKNADPSDDGTGGPGYHIPDEFKLPKAREHFRGSVSMVNTGPRTAGSQFFINLVPQSEMDGHFTVFGRIIEGQECVDRISRGRTTRLIGHYGKIIPGDLLVRAQVIRKRPHVYRVTKEQP